MHAWFNPVSTKCGATTQSLVNDEITLYWLHDHRLLEVCVQQKLSYLDQLFALTLLR